jgi:hypothetical protein
MPFDSLYPEASDSALATRAREVAPAAPVPWFRGAWRAIGQAVPRAGAEMGRTGTALLTPEAVGAMDAPTMFSAPGKTSKPQLADEIREQDAAMRDAIKEFTPDAQSTGAASMVLHDVTKFVGKAAAYSALGGTPLAVGGMAVDEGTNEALRRMDEGVDAAKTLAQTLGLAAVGGPGSYIAEQTVAKHILESAGYDEQAAQVDPFDPLGLGVSFFGSLFFGAGVHGARRVKARSDARAADAQAMAAPEPTGARTEVAQAVARAYTPEQVDAAHVSVLQAQREGSALHAREDVAAAGRHAEALDRASEQLAAGQRVEVGDRAPVEDARIAEEMEALRARAEAETGAVARAPELAAWMEERGILPQEAAEAQAIKGNPFVAMLKDLGGVSMRLKRDIMGEAGIRGNYGGMFTKNGLNIDLLAERAREAGFLTQADIDNPADIGGTRALSELIRRASVGEKIQPALDAQAVEMRQVAARATTAAVEQMERELRALGVDPSAARGDADVLGNFLSEHRDTLVQARLQEINDETRAEREAAAEVFGLRAEQVDEQSRVALASELDENAVMDAAHQATDGVDFMQRVEQIIANAPRRSETPAGRNGTAPDSQVPGGDGSLGAGSERGAEGAADAFVQAESDRIVQSNPDLLVMMEGMDAPVRAADLLAEAKAMEVQELADAPLLRVAAECALRG